MPVPKQRHTKSRRNKRRSHHALSEIRVLNCPKCNKIILPHTMCENCGTYKGREVVDVLARLDKKERKRKQKELAAEESSASAEPTSEGLSAEELSRT